VWIDIPGFSDADRRFLSDRFGFHPVALDIAATRNHMPMVHGYADHVFAVLHRPVVIWRFWRRSLCPSRQSRRSTE
jgi:magnesium transporter